MTGSYLQNNQKPESNSNVYFLHGFTNEIKKGIVLFTTNIDNKGLSNVYVQIQGKTNQYHITISNVYNHKPVQIEKKDIFGKVKVWE